MTRNKTDRVKSAMIAAAILLIAAASSLRAQERARAGYSGISGYQVPLWLGIDLGLF